MQLRSHNLKAFDDSEQANDDGRTPAAVPKQTAPKGKRNRAAVSTLKPIVVEPDESDADDDVQWDEIDRYFIHMEDARPLTSVTASKSALNVDISESTLTSDSMEFEAIKRRLNTRHTSRRLSFNSDVPSSDWEMLSADLQDSNLRHEAAGRVIEPMEHGGKDECHGRFSVSSFGSGSSRSSFYRDDTPSPVCTPVESNSFGTPKRKVPDPVKARRLRFDNESSDSEAEEPTSASSTSFMTASEGIRSEQTSSHEQSHQSTPRFWRAFSGTIKELGTYLKEHVQRTSGMKRAIDANSSEPPLFTVIHGQPDGYTLTENNLGQGNFGSVNVAVREYAVKKVNAADPNAMSQCIEGVAVMRSVSHENIFRLKEAFHDVDSDIFYVIMEKMEGSVYQLIRFNGGYLTEEHALVILRCTAKALEYLHSRGFAHRDVKSDNVLVGRNCEVKLADLDSVAAENAWLNGVAGTPHWVAPEIARIICKLTDTPYTAKVDAWSFAIFATEFALGVPPYFTGEQQPLAEICGTICNPQYVPSVNEQVRRAGLADVARLVEYCLKVNPAQRPSMSDILALMSFLDEPDQQVLLEPIHRMLHRRAMTPNH